MTTAARAIMKGMEKATIVTVVVKNGAQLVEGVGVIWDTGQADVAVANSNAFGIAMSSVLGDGTKTVQVLLLSSAGVIARVKVAAGDATQGKYATCGTDGFTDITLGGGTTVKYVAGKFHESGVDGDLIGMEIGQFAGGTA